MKRLKEFCIKDRTIKFPCLAGFSIIFIAGICAITTSVGAVTLDGIAVTCESSETFVNLIVTEEACPDCDSCCPVCPPPQACEVGYSCQKDDEPGEKQQYPPALAAEWVAGLGCINLTDVALDDPRWGNREEGEVYAQEGNGCLSLYWPGDGDALFDISSVVSNPAGWHDYRFSVGGQPRGGDYTVSTGKEAIRFSDNGSGGMTVFVSDDDTQPLPTGKCAAFLTDYTNPKQSKLPAHRVYPMGQKMMITAWLMRNAGDMDRGIAAGFTMHGPHWDTRSSVIDPIMKRGKEKGLRAAYRLTDGAGLVKKLLPLLDNGEKEARLYRNIKGGLLRAINNPDFNDQIDVWLTGTEEISTRNSGNVDKLNRYLRNFHKIVQDNDPQKRPLWMSDVTGVSKSSMMVTHRYLDMVGPQIYLGKTSPTYGYKTDAAMGSIARTIKATAVALDSQYPQLRPHAATGSLDLLFEPIPAYATTEVISKRTKHWIYAGLNNGMQGFQLYAWYQYPAPPYMTKATRAKYYAAYLAHVKELTSNKLDYAYLWGSKRKDLSLKITNGNSTVHGYPTVSMANIQYGKSRYVLVTNGDNEKSVSVSISGFPEDCSSFTNLTTGKSAGLGTSISPTIEPLGVRLYKISK